MWFSILLAILVLVITFFQATQGLFSAMIMCVFTICCAGAALGTYEWVAIHWLAPYWKPDFAFAIALATTFGVPLVVLRAVTDKLVRRACLLPGWLDRIGGAFCGLVTGLTLVGVMAFAVQNVPFGGSVLGFGRVARTPDEQARTSSETDPPDPKAEERDLLLKPDRFAVGLASILSSGVFSGERILPDDNPDLVQAVGWVNAVPVFVSRYAPAGSISIASAEPISFVYKMTPAPPRSEEPPAYEAVAPESGHEFQMVRVALHNAARDQRKSHVFTLRQFRIVGRKSAKRPLQQYHAIALQQPDATQTVNRHIRYKITRGKAWPVFDDPVMPREGNNNEVEVVFELPTGFKPQYLEYKRGARALLKFGSAPAGAESRPREDRAVQTASAPSEPKEPTTSERPRRRRRSPPGETVADSGRGGNVRGLTTRAGQSFFGDKLPLELKAYQKARNVNVSRGKLGSGHLHGFVDDQPGGKDRTISRFKVPGDKRLLHLNTGRLHTRSGLGKALDFATRTVQNYVVEDTGGRQYKIIGKYAVADVNGRSVVEIQYFPEQAGTVGGVGAFRKIKDSDLKGDYELVIMFLVDPGATIVSFSTGGSATRRDDLSGENLVAPD